MKISLIGCGGIGKVHARIIAESGHVFLSCCDEKNAQADAFAAEYGCKPYTSLKAMLDAEKPDILHICTPHYTHVPLAIYALAQNINVVLEKPASSFAADIDVLLDASNRASSQIAVCFQNRYNVSSQYAKEFLDAGKAGKILGARAFVSWSRRGGYYTDSDWRGSLNTEGASVLINQSIHTVDLLQWLIGSEPRIVEGSTANRTLKGVINTEDTAEAYLTFDGGVTAIFHATIGFQANADISVEIVCEQGTLTITGDDAVVRYNDGRVEEPMLSEKAQALGKNYWGSSHKTIVLDFYEHVQAGTPFPLNAHEGCKALRTCFDIIESGKRGAAIIR